jgi:hypothetical protein
MTKEELTARVFQERNEFDAERQGLRNELIRVKAERDALKVQIAADRALVEAARRVTADYPPDYRMDELNVEEERRDYADLARECVVYFTRNGGCGHCGGLPHTTTCFVGRFAAVIDKWGGLDLADGTK